MLVAALISGGIYALIALGFALGFRMSRVFNLAHGGVLILAAYANYLLKLKLGLPDLVSIPSAILVGSLFGFVIEAKLIPRARALGLRPLHLLLLSWFLLIIIQNGLRLSFSSESIYMGPESWTGWTWAGVRVTSIQVTILATVAFLGIGILALLATTVGKEVIAVGDNPKLASVYGLRVKRLLAINGACSGLLAASAGVLLSYQERIDPDVGLRFSIIAIVSTLIGWALGPAGSILGALCLAWSESFVLYYVDPGLRNATVFGILILILLLFYRRSKSPRGAVLGNPFS